MSQNSSQVKLTGWAQNFLTIFFFGNQGSDDEKVRQKITMMASVSKHSPGPKNRIGKKYIWLPKFWPKNCPGVSRLFFPRPTQARKHELEFRLISRTNLIWEELGLVVDIWLWYMAAVVVYGSGGGIWIQIGGGIWIRIGGRIWIWIQRGGG